MEIYEPREDSEMLAKQVKKLAFGRVLDVGTGSGIQAVEASSKRKVKSVLAVDIDDFAIKNLKNEIKKENKKNKNYKKIKVRKSDLFSRVPGKFETIIFNPPYLPEDKGIVDGAIYGGKKGHEVLGRFLEEAGEHLAEEGIILVVFSSLTGKEKVDLMIERNLLEFKELEKQHIFFEDLFVYRIFKSKVLKELNKKGIKKINYLTKGKRGVVFTGIYKKKRIAIKIKRKESLAKGRIRNEVKWLKILNKKKIGPKLLFYGEDYLVEEFIEGDFILDFINKNIKDNIKNKNIRNEDIKNKINKKKTKNKNLIKKIIVDVLKQCFEMDRLKINKEEMHHPVKHIIINSKGSKGKGEVVLIDFERCYKTEKPHNVTQFGVFLMGNNLVEAKVMVKALKNYKKKMTQNNLIKIIKLLD